MMNTQESGVTATMQNLNPDKFKLPVVVGFILVLFILSSTDVGYIPISTHQSLDLGVIPAIFAAMIGGYRVAIPVAVAWVLIGYSNPASHMQSVSIWSWGMVQVSFLLSVATSYKWLKKKYEYSPYNVYFSIVVSILIKTLLTILMTVYEADFRSLTQILKQGTLEMALSLMAMFLIIKHLRQIHILNGVKVKETKKDHPVKGVVYGVRLRLVEHDFASIKTNLREEE